MSQWYKQSGTETLKGFSTDADRGLGADSAASRLLEHGPNALIDKEKKSLLVILFNQVKEIMVVILVLAGIASILLHEVTDGIVIFIIVVLNTVLGFWQEAKAEKAMTALKSLAVPDVRVKRDGIVRQLAARELVPGDIILFEAGNIIPADARILTAANLKVNESALTGESVPVDKKTAALPDKDLPPGEQNNMAFMGTVVTFGRGSGVVTATGMHTELGKIAGMLQEIKEEETPLQKRLSRLGFQLALAALGLIVVVAGISLLRGDDLVTTIMTAISMAVAAIPEGLAAVVTIALALGARKMLKKRALIRNLASVETLGSVTVICSDKTGTLTQNRMTVMQVLTPGETVAMENLDEQKAATGTLPMLLAAATLCNDAVIELQENGNRKNPADYAMIGDPTEGCLVVAAEICGYSKSSLEKTLPRVSEFPFSSERKRMTTVHELKDRGNPADQPLLDLLPRERYFAFTKGSVDGLIQISDRVLSGGKIQSLSPDLKKNILQQNEALAARGIRVLGMAFKPLPPEQAAETDTYEKELIYIGMVGMIDPVRPEVREAVAICRTAGIRPVMITGDHPLTALYIAGELGMAGSGKCLTGEDLMHVAEKELREIVKEVSVYARVSPEHKNKLIDALQANGQIVSMTGDGVNDAPALKSADIGVAMGITGTDVARQSSDMVLLDDNFATIVAAVHQGRTIFDNIKKFTKYILTGNTSEIFVMLLGPLLGMPLPMLPIQILWINLVTDGAPAIAFGYEPPEAGTMQRPPYDPREGIFARGIGWQILRTGMLVALLSLGCGFIAFLRQNPEAVWRTMTFTTLTFCQMTFALCTRSYTRSLFKINLLSNKPLLGAVILTFLLQLMLIYAPFLQDIFKTAALSGMQLAACFGLSLSVILAVEIEKGMIRKKMQKQSTTTCKASGG